jgi:hypothetical protein
MIASCRFFRSERCRIEGLFSDLIGPARSTSALAPGDPTIDPLDRSEEPDAPFRTLAPREPEPGVGPVFFNPIGSVAKHLLVTMPKQAFQEAKQEAEQRRAEAEQRRALEGLRAKWLNGDSQRP